MKNAFSGANRADDDYFPTADGVKGEDSLADLPFSALGK